MGTLILWAIICGVSIACLRFAWSKIGSKFKPKIRVHGIAITSALISLASYIIYLIHLDLLFLGTVGNSLYGHRSFLESLFFRPHFRNAFFGILIATLTYYWYEHRLALSHHLAHVPPSTGPARKLTDLPLVLIVVITFLAITLAELPGILNVFRVGYGPAGFVLEFRESRDQTSDGTSSTTSGSSGEGTLDQSRLPSLGVLVYLTDQPRRDMEKICELGDQKSDLKNIQFRPVSSSKKSCVHLTKLEEYKNFADSTVKPLFVCMNKIVIDSLNYNLALEYLRPAILSYMETIHAMDRKGGFEDAMSNFIEEGNRVLSSEPCEESNSTSHSLDESKLKKIFSLYNELPYGHIAYAILADFLATPEAGILPLERWQTQRRKSFEKNGEVKKRILEARFEWMTYVARLYQDFMIFKVKEPMFWRQFSRFEPRVRNLLGRMQPNFIRLISSKKYCTHGEINQILLKIYFFHIQDAWRALKQLLELRGRASDVAFANEATMLEEILEEFRRLRSCFDQVYGLKRAGYFQATIDETLGDYKIRFASYIEKEESSMFPDAFGSRLRVEAVRYFREALKWHMLYKPDPGNREEELKRWLSGGSQEIDVWKIRVKHDRLLELIERQ